MSYGISILIVPWGQSRKNIRNQGTGFLRKVPESEEAFTRKSRINVAKRLLEMSSVAENNSLILAIDKLDNELVSVTDNKPL